MRNTTKKEQKSPWSESGYVTSDRYERHYINHQEPIRLSYSAVSCGFAAPDPTQEFRYLDLGCGEGITLACLAAAYPHATFVGIDFNADHISHAQTLVEKSGITNIEFRHCSFSDFLELDAEKFDYIAAHGIISWVTEHDASLTFKIAEKLLRDGGLFYLCYYLKPGAIWTDTIHRLLRSFIRLQEDGSLPERLNNGFQYLKLLSTNGKSPLLSQNVEVINALVQYENSNFNFKMHELGNHNLVARFFSDLCDQLQGHDLHFVGSANPHMNDMKNIVHPEHVKILKNFPQQVQHDQASLLAEDSFRWDVFAKGKGANAPDTYISSADDFVMDPARAPYTLETRVKLNARIIKFDTEINKAVYDLCRDGKMTVTEILDDETLSDFSKHQIQDAVREMVSTARFRLNIARSNEAKSNPKGVYSHGTGLISAIYKRDFLTGNVTYLPSQIAGSTMYSSGFSAIAIESLNGRKFSEAMLHARSVVEAMSEEQRKEFKVEKIITEAGFKSAVIEFRRNEIPPLLRSGVLVQ